MMPNEWEKYKLQTKEDVLHELLTEEIARLDELHGKTGSRYVIRQRVLCLLVYFVVMAVVVLLGHHPIQRASLSIASTIIYAGVTFTLKNRRLSHLMRKAVASPETELSIIAKNDSYVEESKSLFDRLWFVALVCGLGIAGTFLVDPVISPDEYAMAALSAKPSVQATAEPLVYTKTKADGVFGWRQTGKSYTLVSFDAGTGTSAAIPAEVNGLPVSAIAERAFENETTLVSITMPESITEIGSYAFKNCSSLSAITLSDNLKVLGGEAFYGCSSLTAITIPAGVTEIRGNTFQNCSKLKTVTLHDGITSIHAYAFNNCKTLESITLPVGITEIRANTFEGCASLKAIAIPEGVTRIAAHAFRRCTNLSSVTVPSTVKEIGSSAFRDCKALRTITIPSACVVDERSFKDSPTKVIRK
ncbi:MAG: leucine-rich repeat domain-containing protein [Clostridia bacterium]|nr:leucine-rich repeat domain-containing protein [Clostridia bacterium]